MFNCVLGHHGKPIPIENYTIKFKVPQEVGSSYRDYIDPFNLQYADTWVVDLMALFNVQLPTDLLIDTSWQTRAKHISWQL